MGIGLKAVGLHKHYGGVAAVAGVDLAVDPGEIRAVIGPNGAGKSTLFDLVSGWVPPDRGRVFLGEREITGWPARRLARTGLGRSFQRSNTFAGLDVLENVLTAVLVQRGRAWNPWRPLGRYSDERERALTVLAEVGLADKAGRLVRELAYGDQKRLDIAIALAGQPGMLLLDEPLAGLAAAERQPILGIVRRLARDQGTTVLFTEHDIDSVLATAERITVMHQGGVLAEGTPAEVSADPRVRSAFLGEEGPG